jgi:hypothetical protein
MSGPPTSLPAQIAELRTVDVTWEAATAQDGYAQPGYAAPVTLKAWVEPFGFSVGGVEATRRPDETTVEPQYELYFRGDDVAPRSMTTLDRFTLPETVDAQQRPLQPIRVATLAGPPFDDQTPWIIAVTL